MHRSVAAAASDDDDDARGTGVRGTGGDADLFAAAGGDADWFIAAGGDADWFIAAGGDAGSLFAAWVTGDLLLADLAGASLVLSVGEDTPLATACAGCEPSEGRGGGARRRWTGEGGGGGDCFVKAGLRLIKRKGGGRGGEGRRSAFGSRLAGRWNA